MFYIILYVTLKIDRKWELSLFNCYLNSIISTLLWIYNLITLNQPMKLCCYLKKKLKNIMFCKDKCGLTMTFNIGIKFYFVQASSYIYLVQK